MGTGRSTWLALAVLAAGTADGGLARAQATPPTDAPPEEAAAQTGTAASDCSLFREEGDRARAAGKLREARAHYQECARCGSLSCGALATAVLDEIPTVLVIARDDAGQEILDAAVSIDGAAVASETDGKAIALDPGPHLVEVRQRSLVAQTTVTLAPRAKAVPVEIVLRRPDLEGPTRDVEGHTVWPWAIVGLGVLTVGAGIGLIVTAPGLPAGCDSDTRECVPEPNETEASQSLRQRRDTAGQAIGQPIVGGFVIGGGVLIAALGVLWHYLEPTTPLRATSRARPRLAASSSGLSLSF